MKIGLIIWILVFLLIIFPSVSASSFTGNFNDYGNDTGTDGLFDYLSLKVEVDVKPVKDYEIYGQLRDNTGNIIESRICVTPSKNGIYNYTLNFNGYQIYRNKVDGPYNLSRIELSPKDCSGGMGEPPMPPEDSIFNAYTTQAYLYEQFQKGDPAIYCNESPCIAASDLLRSRDNISTPEPNSPNTIDNCEDGPFGSYLGSESIENITTTSLNNSYFKIGDKVNVEIEVYCFSPMDKLNFVYSSDTSNIEWRVMDSTQCVSTGIEKLSTEFELDDNIGEHSIRGVFSFNLLSDTVCGQDDPMNEWADTDDIIINVKECNGNCPATECDQLDACYEGTFRDYFDITNNCLADYSCENNACGDYFNITTDIDGDGYDIECDLDCNDNISSINPDASEICENDVDDDCDELVDLEDPDCVGKYPIELSLGWNLISLPKIVDNNISNILNEFNNSAELVATQISGNWFVYDINNLAQSNLKEIFEENGFWIKMKNNFSLLIENESASSTLFNLQKGWNLIGYPSMNEEYATELFVNVMDDIEVIYTYSEGFESFNPLKPNNMLIKRGSGILVKLKNDASWYFNENYKKGEKIVSLNLTPGWNLISFPIHSNKTVLEVFGTNKLYYLTDKQWKELSGIDNINYSLGYWINSNESTITTEGFGISNQDFSIQKGWNLINYPLQEEIQTSVFFQNVAEDVELVEIFENGVWKTFSFQKPINSLEILKPGLGIFVKTTNNSYWNFNGSVVN